MLKKRENITKQKNKKKDCSVSKYIFGFFDLKKKFREKNNKKYNKKTIKKTTGIQLIYNKNFEKSEFINLPVCRRDFNITFNCFRFVRTQNMCLWSIYNF